MESGTASASASDSSFRSTFVGNSSGSSRSRERFSTPLNGSNCAIWAQTIKVYYLGEIKYHSLTDDPPKEDDKIYTAWMRMLVFVLSYGVA